MLGSTSQKVEYANNHHNCTLNQVETSYECPFKITIIFEDVIKNLNSSLKIFFFKQVDMQIVIIEEL